MLKSAAYLYGVKLAILEHASKKVEYAPRANMRELPTTEQLHNQGHIDDAFDHVSSKTQELESSPTDWNPSPLY